VTTLGVVMFVVLSGLLGAGAMVVGYLFSRSNR